MTNCWTPKAVPWLWKKVLARRKCPLQYLGIKGIRSATYLQMQRKKGLYYSSTLSEMVEMVSKIYKEKKKVLYLVSVPRTALNDFAHVGEEWRQL